MKKTHSPKHSLEILEQRIAPAAVPLTAEWKPGSINEDGSPILLRAGQGLSSGGQDSGDYLLYVEKGNAWVFTTDFNNNNELDFNEITGIAAGDGLRLISFIDIRGDIVTNLKETPTSSGLVFSLSDSNNNPADDNEALLGDGRVVLNSRIEKIELRTLTVADIPDQNRDGIVNQTDVDFRRAPSTHSIFGNIFAGRGFGVPGDPTSGLLIDRSVMTNFGFEDSVDPTIGSIRVGTAVGGEYFSFGITGQFDTSGGVVQQRIRAGVVIGDDTQGYLVPFVPSPGQVGASIAFIRSAAEDQTFNLNGLYAGAGGAGAPGGDILDVTINGDNAGGYEVVAGNGGTGARGGVGGSILRFSDLNSDTSRVIIRSGDGGTGSTGSGGNAGSTDIVESNFYGNYSIIQGNGGDGFTQGGNGASLAKAFISQPTPAGVTSGTGWGTSHNPSYYNPDPGALNDYVPHLGTTQAIDIDNDGFGDFVYSSLETSQIVVLFGDGLGSFRTTETPEGIIVNDRIYLPSPRNAEALTVADLNGDGHEDIAAGSADAGNQAGITVYLAKWEDINKDGDVLDPEDIFLGYHDGRHSPLPQLQTGDRSTPNADLGHWEGPQQISKIVAGDFDGDGANELAVLTTYALTRFESGGITTSLTRFDPTIVFLSPDRELDSTTGKFFFTGQFYADFGTKTVTGDGGTADPEPRTPFSTVVDVPVGGIDRVIIEATALTADATHDVLMVGVQGDENTYSVRVMEYVDQATILGPLTFGSWNFGRVDTNRNPAQGPNPNTNAQPIGMTDFAMVDLNGDGFVDLVGLSQSPGNYMVGVLGDGLGSGTQDSGNGADQSGFFFGNSVDARGIKPMDGDFDGVVDDFAVLLQGSRTEARLYDYAEGASFPGLSGPTFVSLMTVTGGGVGAYRTAVVDNVLWDILYPVAADQGNALIGVGAEGRGYITFFDDFSFRQSLAEPKLNVFAGDGGDSFIGRGGTGGFIGGKGSLDTIIVDPINNVSVTDYIGSLRIEFDGTIRLEAGNGGMGFSKGGNGGSITGVTVRDSNATDTIPGASLVAGDGGRGISGTGGFGGDLIANSILNGSRFFAGDGGDGKFGGRGGNVIGNGLSVGTSRVFDTDTITLRVFAGAGGDGLRGGGAGGNIVNFLPVIEGASGAPLVGGALMYVGGNGGNAISGKGGNGGSVVNSSPELNATLEDQIYIEGGRGGNGTIGGDGGSVSKFSVTQEKDTPTSVIGIIGGHGGNGTTGSGGRGGSVSEVSVISGGISSVFVFNTPGANFGYSRVLAGNGGTSFGGKGGVGGDLRNIETGATQGTIALVSGAGGGGLTQGGAGGSVLNIDIQVLGAGSNSKALVVAGAGGDARAFIPNPADDTPDQDKKAFGGRVGVGGVGGSINGVKQGGSINAHMDLISGNGGSTLHYGTFRDPKPFVGRGGSITNINIVGVIGNVSETAAIQSYNDVLNGETMADYVERKIRFGEDPIETLNDTDGNVGIIVGSAGRNKAVAEDPLGNPYEYVSQPATNAKNGDLINVSARAIMSAVAGSVDRLAAIQLAKNINVSVTFVGTDKGVEGVREFIDTEGNIISSPVRDGRLLDGAFIARNLVLGPNQPTLEGNVFPGF